MLYFKNKCYILIQEMVIYLSKGMFKTLMELLQMRYITEVLHVGEIFVQCFLSISQSRIFCVLKMRSRRAAILFAEGIEDLTIPYKKKHKKPQIYNSFCFENFIRFEF